MKPLKATEEKARDRRETIRNGDDQQYAPIGRHKRLLRKLGQADKLLVLMLLMIKTRSLGAVGSIGEIAWLPETRRSHGEARSASVAALVVERAQAFGPKLRS